MARTQGIILKKIAIGEFDELLVCYTKDFGKIKLIAKGIHQKGSKQRGHLDVLSLSDFLMVPSRGGSVSGGFSKIRSALGLNQFLKIKSDLKLSALGFGALELVNKTIFENQADMNIWNLINNYLEHLNNIEDSENLTTGDVLSLFHSFFANLVKVHGHENGFKPLGRITVNSYLSNISNFFYADFRERLNSLQFLKTVLK